MGRVTRKRHTAEFKARVALEAIKGEQTLAEIGAKHGVHLTMVAAWKKAAIEGMANSFSPKGSAPTSTVSAQDVSKLHAKIGQLIMERDFLAKASGR
jgi:transposase